VEQVGRRIERRQPAVCSGWRTRTSQASCADADIPDRRARQLLLDAELEPAGCANPVGVRELRCLDGRWVKDPQIASCTAV
jgi:hypothetical protein